MNDEASKEAERLREQARNAMKSASAVADDPRVLARETFAQIRKLEAVKAQVPVPASRRRARAPRPGPATTRPALSPGADRNAVRRRRAQVTQRATDLLERVSARGVDAAPAARAKVPPPPSY